jgi:hypothetical protein
VASTTSSAIASTTTAPATPGASPAASVKRRGVAAGRYRVSVA